MEKGGTIKGVSGQVSLQTQTDTGQVLCNQKGDYVLDIGCHPGGWTQVAVEESGENGLVIGVDLLATSPVEGARLIIGDATEDSTLLQIRSLLEGEDLNVVISDISPRLTGRYDTDQAISLELSTTVLDVAIEVLRPGGTFVTKTFQGTGIEGLVEAQRTVSPMFRGSPRPLPETRPLRHI